jgi:threonine dehydratase
VVAARAGNHGQGVALAAAMLGTTATVFMPVGAALPKLAATRGYGAQVHLVGDVVEQSLAAAREVGPVTFAHVSALVDDVVTVGEEALSGGNVDPLLLMYLIRHGLSADGRFLALQFVADLECCRLSGGALSAWFSPERARP